jgi:hypothetical protein
MVLGMELWALYILDKCSTTELHPQPVIYFKKTDLIKNELSAEFILQCVN